MADTTGNSKRSETSRLEELRIKREELEILKLEDEVAKLEAARKQLIRNREQTEYELADYKRRQLARQDACNHRKGGMDLEGINGNGNDNNYALAQHQLGDGRVLVLCMRCLKEWMPGDADYNAMRRAPTDNKPSAAAQFDGVKLVDVHQFQDAARA